MTELVRREELQAAIEARAELGADMEPAVIDAFVEQIGRRLADGAAEREQALKRKREHQKELVLGAARWESRSPCLRSPPSSPVLPASSWSVERLQ